jgi:hypothetical protein
VQNRIDTELLINGGMELDQDGDHLPDAWVLVSTTGKSGKLKCSSPPRTVTASGRVAAHSGDCLFVFTGRPGRAGTLRQNLDLSEIDLSSGDLLTLRAWSHASAAGITATAKLTVKYLDATAAGKIVRSLSALDWTESMGLLTVNSAAVKKIKLQVKFSAPTGKLSIDDLSLTQGVIAPRVSSLPLPVLPLPSR